MSLWDDIKRAAGNVKDEVVDVFDGADQPAPKPDLPQAVRPEVDPSFKGQVFQRLNPAFKKRENEFEKPLWMTGADTESPFSSWDNDYLKRTFDQQTKLADEGKLGNQFDLPDATGIVTYDHDTKSGKKLQFGDVFDKGKLVGNLYEDKTGTEADADLMMGQFLLEPEELANIGQDRNPEARMRQVIQEKRDNNNIEIPQALAAQEQQGAVDKTQAKIQEAFGGKGDDLAAGGIGAGGGLTLGAGIGTAIAPGIGTLVGGAIGLGVGGLAGWLNRDDISEQIASANEITKKAYDDDQGNVVGDTGSAIKQWAGVLGRGLSPLSNLARGAVDSDRGNGVGALQEEDRPGWAKPLDIAATIGDMGLTFGSPAGIAAYTGQMGAVSAGALTELTLGGGERWDPQAGQFRNVYENEQGDVSLANGAGAWGSTLIDVGQLAMVRGIASKITGAETKAIGTEVNGGKVAHVEERAGRTFYLDADKKVLDSKVNFAQAFIPSEGVQLLAASGTARAAAVKSGRSFADEAYTASVSLARAEAPIKAALVNAIGEGTEEAVQEALDTWSFDHKVDLQTLAEAYAYGAASGLGMGLAANYQTRASDNVELNALTRSGYELQHGQVSDADWKALYKSGLSAEDKKSYRAANFTPEQRAALKQALSTSIAEQGGATASGLIISNAVAKTVEAEQDRLTSRAGVAGRTIMRAGANTFQSLKARADNGTVKIENGAVADDSGATGFTGLLTQYQEKLKRLPEILSSIDQQIADAQAELDRRTETGADTGQAQAQIDKLKDTRALWEGSQPTLEDIIQKLTAIRPILLEISTDDAVNAGKRQQVDKINQYLDGLYRSQDHSVALAAAKFRLRPPLDNVGSLYVTAPALDWSMVRDGFDGTETMDWASLDTTTADFDGDRITGTTSLILGRNGFLNARSGLTWLNTAADADGKITTSYKVASVERDAAISTNMHLVATGLRTSSAKESPRRAMNKFVDMVAQRYGMPAPEAQHMKDALTASILNVQTDKPIETLMTYVAQVENPVSQRMMAYAQANSTNEASVISGMYRSAMDQAVAEVNEARKAAMPKKDREKTKAPAPNVLGTGQTIQSQQGATLYSTFLQYYGTQDSLRIGQVLRQSGEDYTDRGVAEADQVPLLVAAGATLRELAKGKIEAAYAGGLDAFDVTARVHEMALDITSGDHAEAFDLLLRPFGAASFDGKDNIQAHYNVTVAQALTESVVAQLRRQGALAISRDQELENKIRLLETAARDTQDPSKKTRSDGAMLILRDALGMFNVADVAGIGATAGWETSGLLTQGTITQNVRALGKHSRADRAAIRQAQMDFADSSANPDTYQNMVGFIHELTNSEYSVDRATGKVYGRIHDRNERASQSATEIRQNVRKVVQELGLPLTHDGVLRALSTQNGQQILEGFIKQTSIASFTKDKNGTYVPRAWVLDYFITEKDGEAEVLLWRNRALTALHLASTRKTLSADIHDEDIKNEYERVDDSLAKFMLYLRDLNPAMLSKLEIELNTQTSRESLEQWINKNSQQFGIPVLMYENSAAQFDPSLRSGGWGSGQSTFGADIREVAEASRTFLSRTTEMEAHRAVNIAAWSTIRGLMDDPNNGKVRAAKMALAEAANVDQFKTLDPNDTQEALVLIHELVKNMHTKGAEPESIRAHAAQQLAALIQTGHADPFVDSTNLALGKLDIQDLRARPELVFTITEFSDDYGRLVKVPPLLGADGKPDLALVAEAAINDKQTGLADLLSEAMLPRAFKHNRTADISTIVHRGPRNMKELFEQRFDTAFETNNKGNYTTGADMALGVEISAAAQTADQKQVAAFERAVLAVAMPRILSAKEALDSTDIAKITDEVRHQLAAVLRMAGQYINSSEGSEDLYRAQVSEAALELIEGQVAGQRQRQESYNKYRVVSTATRTETQNQLFSKFEQLAREFQTEADVNKLIERIASGRYSQAQQDALLQEVIQDSSSAPIVRLFQSAVNGDPYGDLEYLYGSAEVQTANQRTAIAGELTANPDLDAKLLHDPKATAALRDFRDGTIAYAAYDWATLRNIVISNIIQKEANPVGSQSDFLLVFDNPIRQDPTFSTLFKELLLPDKPLVAAARGITSGNPAPVDLTKLRQSMEALFPADGSIRWDQSIGAMTEALDATYPSISAGKAAAVHGNTGKTADALAMAARTNTIDVPPAEFLKTVRIRRITDGIQIIGSPDVPVGVEMLNGAIGLVDGKVLDPMVVPGLQGPYTAMTTARLERALTIGEEVDVQFFHPMYRPAGAKWHNSLYFDGVAAHNSPLVPEFPSLIAEMYMQPNGITQRGTRFTLDAVKKKMPALYRTSVTAQGGLDLNAVSDPTEYLGTIATILSGTELGYGTLSETFFRAILKYVTMRHVVLYSDGTSSSVYEYMAQRAINPDATAARGPQLMSMSERTANTLYGEVGTQGLRGFPPSGQLAYGQQLFSWDALTEQQNRVLRNLGESVRLGETSAATRGALSGVSRGSQAEFRTAVRDFGQLYALQTEASRVWDDRLTKFHSLGRNIDQMRVNQQRVANDGLVSDMQAAALQVRPDGMESLLANMPFQEPGFATGASYPLVVTKEGTYHDGNVTPQNFAEFKKKLGDVVFGDSVVLDLDQFNDQDLDDVLKITNYMIGRKATVTVRGGKAGDVRDAVQSLLINTSDYAPIVDQTGTYAPIEALAVYQMERAYISRAMEQRNSSAESRLLTFIPNEGQVGFGAIGESAAAIINPGKRQVVRNLLLKQFGSEYLTPIHRADTPAIRDLITDPEFIAALRAAPVDGEIAGLSHDEAVNDLIQRAHDGALPLNTKNLSLRKGMFEVYVVNAAKVGDPVKVYLHRAGSKFIKDEKLVELRRSANRFVTGPTDTEAQQTFVEGVVEGSRVRNDGLLLDIKSEQFWRNNKLIPHTGGNKVMTQALAEDLAWLRESIAGDLSFDLVVNSTDSMKKLSMMDSVRDFASAAELLGFDNMAIFYQGAYGEKYDSASSASQQRMSALRVALNGIAKNQSATHSDVAALIDLLAKGVSSDYRVIALTTLADADPTLTERLGKVDMGKPHTRVLLSAMAYLTLPGAQLSDIETAGGFTDADARVPGRGSRRMPDLFTRIYDLADDTRELALLEFNGRLEANSQLLDDYTLRITHDNQFTDGRMAFSSYSVVGESQGDNYDPTTNQGVSSHDLRVIEQAADATFANNFSAGAFNRFLEDVSASDTLAPLRTAPTENERLPWHNIGVAQQFYRAQVAEKLSWFFHPITLGEEGVDSETEIQEIKDLIRAMAKRRFRDSTGASDRHIHTMIRLMLGRPAASKDSETQAARISLDKVRLALAAIDGNMDAGYSPLRRGAVSLVPLEIRNALIAANLDKEGGWAPRVWTDKQLGDEFATTIETFTRALFDHSLADPEANNIDAFNNVMDAIYHQYQQTSADAMSLPVSLSLVRDLNLMSYDFQAQKALDEAIKSETTMAEFFKENPAALTTSLFRGQEIQLTPAVLHEMTNSATIAQKIGMNDGFIDSLAPSAEVLSYVESRLAAYARSKDIPFPTKRTKQQVRDTGGALTDNDSNSHRIFRNLLALHAAKALFSPPLALGAMVDSRMRMVVTDSRRLLTGESLSPVGRWMANIVEGQRPDGQPTRAAALARGLGWRVMYTDRQVNDFKRILNTTALTGPMNEVIYKELASYSASLNQQGVIRPIAALNRIAVAMQDLGHGTKGKAMRRTYLQTAIADLVFRQGQDLDKVLAAISYDGAWIAKKFPASHNAGVQAMNDLRGTQETVISSAISAAIRPLTHSGNAGANGVAQMTLAMPLMFQRYAANLFLTLTGARAIDQLAAHALNGRQKPGFWNAITAKANGRAEEAQPTIDMSDVIGGLDAMDAVINMGITHSLLFTGGLVLGGLGLGGEDDEERRRRRAAAAQGAVWLSDPREIENDFRNAHALFLDEIPGLNVLFKNDTGRAIASPHWIIKPLTSPLLGMERFFETGDIRQLKWGFEDAITSMPLFNMITLNKALTASEELSHAAQDSAAQGNPGASDSAGFLTHLVAYYESALFESSFLNAIYVGFDDYDRDPYVLPLRDSDGTLQRDAEGNVRANSDQHLSSKGLDGRGLALQTYVDSDGKVQQGYWTESDSGTKSRVLAENRLSYALISSLFTGLSGKGLNTRFDQAVKTRTIDKPKLSSKEQQAAILRRYVDKAQEKLLADDKLSPEQAIALSFLNDKGEEILTDEGAKAIFKGMAGGSVTADDDSLLGVYVDFDQRQKIHDDWLDELTIEGMRMGLSESSAKFRANKVMNGAPGLPGIADILYDKTLIPYSKTQEFQQLNTTYMQGPDGNIWATGFSRQKLLGAMGLAPLQGMHTSEDTHTGMDGRQNVSAFGINNTGQRSLRPVNDSLDVPTDAEIGDAITRAVENLNQKDYSSGFGRGGFGGFGGYGGGGGGGYAPRPVNNYAQPPRWTNLNYNPFTIRVPYANDTYSVRTDDVRTDLSTIRRERISSERGRLTQWQ